MASPYQLRYNIFTNPAYEQQFLEVQTAAPELSVVIPIYNEEENIPHLHKELTEALEELGRTYEVIAIDDGSRDNSFEELKKVHDQDDRWRVIRFRRNFGQTAGLTAGFDAARGDWIITIDADLQNNPRDIGKLLAKTEEGYDIVSGWRQDRKENFVKRRLPSMIANGLISRLTDVRLHDYGCTLKVYSADVVRNVELYGELHRFIPAIASWMGVKVAEVPVSDRARRFGSSKYGMGRIFRVILDLTTVTFLLKYAHKPMHFFGPLGLFTAAAGFFLGLMLTYQRFFMDQPLADRPLLLLAVLLIILGINLVGIGLLAEIMMRNYYNPQGKPTYVVRHVLDNALPEPEESSKQPVLMMKNGIQM